MIEYIVTEQFFLAFSGFLIAEIFSKPKFRLLVTFQGLKNIRTNLEKISKKIAKRKSAYWEKTFHLHHSRLGWFLAGISVIISNLSLLSFSLGVIFHHLVKERKIF